MEAQLVQLTNRGMSQDASISKASNEFAYKNYNIRITPIDDNTLLSVTNEKGPLKLDIKIKDIDGKFTNEIEGKLVGYSILNDTIVLFTKSTNLTDTIIDEPIEDIETEDTSSIIINPIISKILTDSIYKLEIDDTTDIPTLRGERLFKGDLNFSDNNILETLSFYESDKSQKVYWVDGVNIPRFINLSDTSRYKIPNHFDFIPSIDTQIKVSIAKEYNSLGVFPAGVIQYFITYYNKYGQETGIIYSSPLNYITSSDIGLDGETNSSCDFKITLSNIDTNFDFIKIYSAIRTSEDATPIIKVVSEISIADINQSTKTTSIIDDNKIGYADSIGNLMALQKSFFSAKTLENKDNVLFMGNIYIESNKVKDSITQYIKSKLTSDAITKDSPFVYFEGGKIVGDSKSFQLNNSEIIKTFKYGETYRFAIQFLDKYSNWTEPVWIGDKTCNIQPYITDDGRYIASYVRTIFDKEFTYLVKDYYIKQRLLIANPTVNDRTILAQGIVLPTVFSYKDRVNNQTFAYQSWIARPRDGFMRHTHMEGLGSDREYLYGDGETPKFDDRTEIQNTVNYAPIVPESKINAYIISIYDYHHIGRTNKEKKIYVQIYKYNGLIPSKKVIDAQLTKMTLVNSKYYSDAESSYNTVVLQANSAKDMFAQALNPYRELNYDTGNYDTRINDCITNYHEILNNVNFAFNKIKEEIKRVTNVETTNGLTANLLKSYIHDVGSTANGSPAYFTPRVIPGTNNWYSIGYVYGAFTEYITRDYIDFPPKLQSEFNQLHCHHSRVLSTYIEVSTQNQKKDIELTKNTDYYIDESIVTLHSPELNDTRYLIDNNNLNFRIVGLVDNISTKFNISLQTDPNGLLNGAGLLSNYNKESDKPVNFIYKDCGYAYSDKNLYINKETIAYYPIYMWNKADSLNFITNGDVISVDKEGKPDEYASVAFGSLKHKIMCWYQKSNHMVSIDLDKSYIYNVIPRVFNSEEPTALTFDYLGDTKVYQGNLDIVNATREQGYTSFWADNENFDESTQTIVNKGLSYGNSGAQKSPVHIKYKSTEHCVFTLTRNSNLYKLPYLNYYELQEDGTYKRVSDYWDLWKIYTPENNNLKPLENKNYEYSENYKYPWLDGLFRVEEGYKDKTGYDPKFDSPYESRVSGKEYKEDNISIVNITDTIKGSYFLLGELYRNIPYSSLYGGTSEEALKALKWIPASVENSILDKSGNYISVSDTYGDTYFQNYDYLMSYPYTEEDKNSIINIVSFPCETHINVAGRYDKRFEEFNLLGARKTNFPLRNPIYSQKNNLFTYSILSDKFKSQRYANQIISSNKKGIQETIDTWTKISPASAVTTDGSYGEINKLVKLNNTIVAFQNKAISTVNFNDRTALTSTSNIQVVLGQSDKIEGISIIDNSTGCQNRMSICTTNSGIYFIDDYKKALMRINKEGIQNISGNGMTLWFRDNLQGNEIISYDSLYGDIYISNDKSCIVYNENLQSFTSFMDYQHLQWMFNIKGKTYSLWNNNIDKFTFYKMFAGDYNTTFEENEYNGYEVVYKVNPEPHLDKIFSNVEYIADCYSQDSKVDNPNVLISENPFDKLEVWNEYQKGITTSFKRGQYPNFAKKFRIWRVDIPRDSTNKRDRIRNPWMIMSLSKNSKESYKMVFHDLIVKYYK